MASADAVVPRPHSLALRRRTPSLLRGLLAGVLALLGPGLLPASNARADEGTGAPGLTAPASFRVAPHGGKPRPDREKRILIKYDRGAPRGTENRSTLTMDVTDSADVLRLKKYGSGCSGTDRKIVCHVGEAYDSWTDWAGALPRAAPGSEPGDTGELHISFRTAQGDVSRATTRVKIGGPLLALRERSTLRVGPEKEHTVPLGVRNTGELPADGFVVTTTVGEGLSPVRRTRSCAYASHGGATTVTCRFPGVRIGPGEEAHVADWLVLDTSRSRMHATFRSTVTLLGTGADNGGLDGRSRSTAEPSPSGTAREGTGAALVPRVAEARAEGARYSEEKDVWTKVRIANHPDYALFSKVSAADDGGRRLRVGLRNDGPGDPRGGDEGTSLVLTFPEGTEVRKEPTEEIDENVFEPVCRHKKLTYTCPLGAAAPGASSALDFEVREAKGGETGSGKARATLRIGDTGADHADTDAANNRRVFALFGPASAGGPASAEAGSGVGAGVVVAGALGGCVVLAAAAVLVRRRLRRR